MDTLQRTDDHGDRRRHGGEHSRRRRDASPCSSPSMPPPRSATRWRKRVKALNERREQLKAGIVASTSQAPQDITNKNEMADKVRGLLVVAEDAPGGAGREGAGAG